MGRCGFTEDAVGDCVPEELFQGDDVQTGFFG